MTFWGCALKPGQKQKVDIPQAEVLHLSQICLHEPKTGKNYLQVQVNGTGYTFACLEKDKVEHNSLDLFFGPDPPTFVNKGTNEVHLSGYMEPMDDKDDDDEDDEEEEPAAKGKAAAVASKASPKVSPKTSPAVAAAKAVEEAKKSPKASPKATPVAKADEEEDDDDDEDEEEEEEEGEEEEEAEESEEEEAPAPKAKASPAMSPKRKAEEVKEQPAAKKAKASPKAAPASSPKAAAKADPSAEYTQQLVDFLKKNGKTKLSDLGTKVKRPAGVPKMKTVFDSNKDKFVVAGDSVEAK